VGVFWIDFFGVVSNSSFVLFSLVSLQGQKEQQRRLGVFKDFERKGEEPEEDDDDFADWNSGRRTNQGNKDVC
jgi:hypothetical protein